jgi:hypothetical protein
MKKYVYHSSKTQNLKTIIPKPSTHKIPWVYATKDIATTAMFLGEFSDFICQTGNGDNDIPYIFERFEGAFDLAFKDRKGSIYKLLGKNFKEGQTTWSAEVVSDQEEKVIEEYKVNNVIEYLEKLENEGKLKIYRYPEKFKYIPEDKSDLVERGVQWTIDFSEDVLTQVQKYHPDILERVIDELVEKGYEFKDMEWENYKLTVGDD